MSINRIGLEMALAGKKYEVNQEVKPAEGRFSLLTLIVMAEAFKQEELYGSLKEKFEQITGLHAESYLNLIDSPEAPEWYNSLAGYVLGVVSEKNALLGLVEAGFRNNEISLLMGKERGETYKALIKYGLWSEYMKHHHSGRNWTNPRDAEIRELAEAGLSLNEIAKALGVTKQGASYLLHQRPDIYELWRKARFKNR